MDTNYIRELYSYDRWANARVLDAVGALSGEQFTRDLASSFRSVRDTLVHILSAESIWLARWNGGSPKSPLNPADFPALETLRRSWTEHENKLSVFLAKLTDERLQEVVAYTTIRGEASEQPLWQLMAHLANHSTYHRGQIATMLRQLGAKPAGTDLIAYFRETK